MKKLRHYTKYDDYVEHQKKKSLDPVRRKKWLTTEWDMKIKMFTEVFSRHTDIILPGYRALCLCARTGQEVVALQNMGLEAIGIDLVASPPFVIEGDIHNIDFPDESIDFAFSNSFDHSLYPDTFISETERILKKGGHALMHFQFNVADDYAENKLETIDPVLKLFTKSEIILSQSIEGMEFPSYHWEVIAQKC